MGEMKTCIVLEAIDPAIFAEMEAMGDFVAEATVHSITAHSIADREAIRDVPIDMVIRRTESAPLMDGIPDSAVIMEAWRPAATWLLEEIAAMQERLAKMDSVERFTGYIDTSEVVTMMHYFQALTLPIWTAIGSLLTARDPATTVLLALAQAGPLDNEAAYGRANSGGRWFVEGTPEGNILRRCGLDRERATGYWGSALTPETYDLVEILGQPSAPEPSSSQSAAPGRRRGRSG